VIGAGPLGLELAQALARLDVDVVVLDEGETIAGLKDRDLAKVLRETIEQEVPIHLGVKTAARNAPGGVEVSWTGDSEGTRLFDKLLVAIGRPPRFDGLEVAAAGLKLDDNGVPVFDPTTLQCGSSPIFIVGDADHDRAVLHDAANEGGIAGHNAATFPKIEPSRRTVPMSIMFTDPPLAVVGKIGRPNDLIVVRGCASYTDQGRAKITLRNTGAVHIYADAQDGRIVGAALACPGAEHLAHLLAWAIEFRQTAIQFLEFPIYHPTYEEGLKPALREICAAVKAETPTDRDDGFIPGA
jgi:dihydrolipoamide dehydrogenase